MQTRSRKCEAPVRLHNVSRYSVPSGARAQKVPAACTVWVWSLKTKQKHGLETQTLREDTYDHKVLAAHGRSLGGAAK